MLCLKATICSPGGVCLLQVISRALLSRPKDEQKLQLEIALHEQLSHHHIVRCLGHFVDDNNIYLMLEHCCECRPWNQHPQAGASSSASVRAAGAVSVVAAAAGHQLQC